jgi:hypothetical protein
MMNKNFLIIWSLFLCGFSVACNENENNDPFLEQEVEFVLSADTLYTASTVSDKLQVTVKNINAVSKVVVKKKDSNGITNYKTLTSDEIQDTFTFEYNPKEQDDEQFNLVFQALNKNNAVLATKNLVVETRLGIIVSGLVKISRITGKTLPNEFIPNPNKTDELYNVGGTDLGIIWDMENGSYGLFFGDTYGRSFKPAGGGPGPAGNWRSNVLAFSNDTDLDDGLSFSNMALDSNGNAREIAFSAKNTSGNGDYTAIPTGAIRADGVDYLHYMNIRTWDGWVTNYSSLYSSNDNGITWKRCNEVLFSSNSNFGQVAYAKKDGYVYMMGTPTGRDGSACLARIPEKSMLKKSDYEYWNKQEGWVKGNENAATVVVEGKVGEASLMYHQKFKRWIFTYLDADKYALIYRDAPDITGPWAPEKVLVYSKDYPALYGSFMHPGKASEDKLYFTMSQWDPYNVFLMRANMICVR